MARLMVRLHAYLAARNAQGAANPCGATATSCLTPEVIRTSQPPNQRDWSRYNAATKSPHNNAITTPSPLSADYNQHPLALRLQ